MKKILDILTNDIEYMNLDIITSPNINKTIDNYLIQLLIETKELIKINIKCKKSYQNYFIKQKIKAFIYNDPDWTKILNNNFFKTIISNIDEEQHELFDFYFLLNTMNNITKDTLNELYQIYTLFILVHYDRTLYSENYKQIIFNRRKGIAYNYEETLNDINENINILKPKIRKLNKEVPNEK